MLQATDVCIKCTLCTSQCPVVSVNSDFPGPKALGPEWYRSHLAKGTLPMDHVDDCTFCQICEAACPVGVPIAHMIAEHKALVVPSGRRRLRDSLLARPHWVGKTARWTKRVPKPMRVVGGLSRTVPLPMRRQELVETLGPNLAADRGTVGLFVDCYSGAYEPGLVDKAASLLRLWGYRVTVLPKGGCCGAAAFAAGKPSLAKHTGHRTADRLQGLASLDAWVTLNATCDGTLREEWPSFYGIRIDCPVVPFDELAEEAPEEFWIRLRSVRSAPGWLVHTTCRGKVARGDGHLVRLARRAGLEGVEPSDAVCCGAAGSYAFKEEHEDTAERLVERLKMQSDLVRPVGIITDSGTCAIHIQQATAVETRHPAHWLHQRYVHYLKEASTQ